MSVLSEMNPSTIINNKAGQTAGVQGLSRGIRNQSSMVSRTGFQDALRSAAGSMESIFDTASKTYGVSKKLLMAVAKQESNFNPNAVSSAGAQGVMQLMPETAKGLGVTNPFDPYQSIMGGAKLLRDNLKKFGSVPLALAAYNAGAGAVQKYGGIPPYQETQNYVKNIMKTMGDSSISIQSNYNYGNYSATGFYGSSSLSSVFQSGLDGMGLSTLLQSGSAGMLSGLSSMNSSSILDSLLSSVRTDSREAAAGDGAEDTVTMDKKSFQNLVQLLRVQMMMNSGSIGSMGDI